MDNDIAMERVKLSVSVLDLLNFIVPGATLIAVIAVFEVLAPPGPRVANGFTALWATMHPFITGQGWLIPALVGLTVVLAAYVVGHVIDSVANLLIDRVLIYKGFGYPYANLLGTSPTFEASARKSGDSRRWREYSRNFFRGTFVLLNVYWIARWLQLYFQHTQDVTRLIVLQYVIYGLDVCLILQLVLKVSCSSVRASTPSPLGKLITSPVLGISIYQIARSLAVGIAWPFRMWSALLVPVLNTRLSFNAEFRDKYKDQFERLFGLDAEYAESNNYWMTYCYVSQRAPSLALVVKRWETLYLFSRNLATAFFLSFQFVVLWMFAHASVPRTGPSTATWLWVAAGLYGLSVLFLIHVYYGYVSYFSKLLFRSFVFLAEEQHPLGRPHAMRSRAGRGAP